MIISKKTPMNVIEVWSPRYHDRRALVAIWKVGHHNKLVFPKANSMPGEYYISGEKITQYPIKSIKTKSGQTAKMYQVPIDDLELLEYQENLDKITRETALKLFPDKEKK